MLQLKVVITGFAMALLPLSLFSQIFTAGQTTGANILTNDFADLYLSSDFWWDGDYRSIDLNGDDINDIEFWTQWVYYSHIDDMSALAGADPFAGIEFSAVAGQPDWIRKHAAGEVIDRTLNWISGNGVFYGISSSGPCGGDFSGPGYMAYRICHPDTLYGWIRVDRGTELGPSTLTLFELAFVTDNSSLGSPERVSLNEMMRISGQTLILTMPDRIGQEHYLLDCYDVSGRRVFRFYPGTGTQTYDLSRFTKGTCILRLSAPDGTSAALKIII